MKLIDGKVYQSYRVIEKNLPVKINRRLEALGMTVGTEIGILHQKKHNAMVIKVRGTRFAVGKDISEHIQVEEVTHHE